MALKNPVTSDVVEMEPKSLSDKVTQTRNTGQKVAWKGKQEVQGKGKNSTTMIGNVENSRQKQEQQMKRNGKVQNQRRRNGAENSNEHGNGECDENDGDECDEEEEECDGEEDEVAEDEVELDEKGEEECCEDEDGEGNIN